MKILASLFDGQYRFLIVNSNANTNTNANANKHYLFSSPDVSKCFNISLEEYENRVVNNVIKHEFAKVIFASNFIKRNIAFKGNNISEEVYVERYKEEFAKELILLVLSEEGMG